ncbi:Predicted metalloprotease, contains C-terminal PDZ domain [Hymenobacter gelipurpurascens]|uniref:Predicted metalloprotease, contains C-terminal PDZ domain n=1 Tax=Hymenobacter gelipurpurascens TaxID=89968 RepID=A0A212UFT2_9BACT|nr:peptidase M61 [Hymenobacter gelipurpurascens]SNC77033.1 Predicted metalloprotease, contains C-terminal PDZ domain [Hymenobacter gelipurpurascens]
MKTFYLALGLGLAVAATAQAQQSAAGYQIALDLQNIQNDRVKVVVQTPPIKEAQVTYVMPSVVPGSYSKKDYGRFVTSFKAFDSKDKPLKVKNNGPNLFVIDNAKNLARLEYLVDDTWDAKQDDSFIFQPGGTNIEAGRNVTLNHYGFYGYLEGYKMLPYQVSVQKPADFYGASALDVRHESPTKDVFSANDYVTLADGPVLYNKPDTASFSTGGARISVAVLSEGGVVKAAQVSEMLRPMSEALTKFFGKMPVPKYQFLMYFPSLTSPLNSKNGGYGAMEHSYSSLYFLPEIPDQDRMRSMVLEVASHEFLHMLAPLNIHSKEIGEFDFQNPKMSQHLWLYEGVTEYVSQLVQVRGGLITPDEFRERMKGKIDKSQEFKDVSFTEMSRKILEAPYKDMYNNVYEKGALLGLLLDIRIRELSQGRQTLRDVLLALREKYGPNRSFEDSQLIPEVVALTNPQLQQFFDRYVIGAEPLPLQEYFGKIGWTYAPVGQAKVKAFGNIGFGYDQGKDQFRAMKTKAEENAFGLNEGDVILAINGQAVNMQSAEKLLRPLVEPKTADPVRVKFRTGANGPEQERQATPREFDVEVKNLVEAVPTPTPTQQALQDGLFKG